MFFRARAFLLRRRLIVEAMIRFVWSVVDAFVVATVRVLGS